MVHNANTIVPPQQPQDLSPFNENLDNYITHTHIENPPFFTNTLSLPGHNYHFSDAASNFQLNDLPTGDTVPRAYPGAGLNTAVTAGASPDALFNTTGPLFGQSRESSSEDFTATANGNPTTGPFDLSYNTFLPSPPDVDEGANGTTVTSPAISPKQQVAATFTTTAVNGSMSPTQKQRVERKKRTRRHSTPNVSADHDRNGQTPQNGEKRRSMTQLRTASRAPKTYKTPNAKKVNETPEEVKARAAHNQVEQQYRKRLNAQFERLLSVLPQQDNDDEALDDENGEGGGRMGMDKRISKAEVLDLARRRIKVLEKEVQTVHERNLELLANDKRMKEEWTRTIGAPPPGIKVER